MMSFAITADEKIFSTPGQTVFRQYSFAAHHRAKFLPLTTARDFLIILVMKASGHVLTRFSEQPEIKKIISLQHEFFLTANGKRAYYSNDGRATCQKGSNGFLLLQHCGETFNILSRENFFTYE